MSRLDNRELECLSVKSANGKTYALDIEVSTYCIREGNYSSVAEDPEEYFGIYKTTFEIVDCYVEDVHPDDIEPIPVEDIPEDVIEELERQYED